MYGFIYVTENLVNGKRYIGQRMAQGLSDDAYLGSGTLLKRAIKKYGTHNFKKTIIAIASCKEELNAMEIEMILLHQAVADAHFYNIAAGGSGGNTLAGFDDIKRAAFANKLVIRWKNMNVEQRLEIAQRLRDKNCGCIKTAEHRLKISKAKMGINNWTPEGIKKMVEKRRAQIALGIGVPPKGNRGNKNFRHSEANKVAIKAGIAKARERVFLVRDNYFTEKGLIAMREKLALYYTPGVRQKHAKLIRDGQECRLAEYKARGIAPPKFHWYHDPIDPTQRATFSAVGTIPEGWIAGMGKRARKVNIIRVHELIEVGWKNADIAREIGCAPSAVWQIRRDLTTAPPIVFLIHS
jgi:hypothetical protein